jgi:hypothetical protein
MSDVSELARHSPRPRASTSVPAVSAAAQSDSRPRRSTCSEARPARLPAPASSTTLMGKSLNDLVRQGDVAALKEILESPQGTDRFLAVRCLLFFHLISQKTAHTCSISSHVA